MKQMQKLEALVERMIFKIQKLEAENQKLSQSVQQLEKIVEEKNKELAEQKWKETIQIASGYSFSPEMKDVLLEKIEILMQEIEDCLAVEEAEESSL